jgi:hypothetical protein
VILSDLDTAGACVVVVPAECSVDKMRTSATGTEELQEGSKMVNTLSGACTALEAPCTACLSQDMVPAVHAVSRRNVLKNVPSLSTFEREAAVS